MPITRNVSICTSCSSPSFLSPSVSSGVRSSAISQIKSRKSPMRITNGKFESSHIFQIYHPCNINCIYSRTQESINSRIGKFLNLSDQMNDLNGSETWWDISYSHLLFPTIRILIKSFKEFRCFLLHNRDGWCYFPTNFQIFCFEF